MEREKVSGMRLILPEIRELLSHKEVPENLDEILEEFNPVDVAEAMPELEPIERVRLLSRLRPDFAGEIFSYLGPDDQLAILEGLEPQRTRALLSEVEPDDRADLFEELPPELKARFLSIMENEAARETRELLQYPSQSAGGLMTPRFLEVKEGDTVSDALDRIRRTGQEIEQAHHIFVTDSDGRLVGHVSLRGLVMAAPQLRVSEIMNENPVAVTVSQDQEEVARQMRKYDLVVMPVVGADRRLKGVVAIDDAMDVLTEEQTEDMYKFGAVAGGFVDSYSGQNPFSIVRHRIPWLVMLVLLGFISGFVIDHYSLLMQQVIALAVFIPLLMGAAGNAGTQASTVMVRGLATGEVRLRNLWRVVEKELLVGLMAGLILGLLAVLRVMVLREGLMIALVVAVSMTAVVALATTIGAALPLICKRFGLDPAVVSSPLLATVMDISTLFIYFEIGRRLLF
ncbi:MAG TPA: magnesium transporter [bacterium]|uniref:Magnesium transporter MgtE n=1 Tax=candidate division TA06 bacterium ADurb.Bin417 TaxID=1852828 RepID=A0A1V5MHK9_UNCT6|nr:MAG: Magnesium transporter MgtE [candidate division TA06 bacterium ADurb.Bin417]HNQ35473.1 magnesium transporter [bacterium]HNS48715.1 magnesium transporter [bacterium]